MILNYLIDNLLPIIVAIGGAIAWLAERKKRKAEIKGVEVTTEQGNAEVFQKMRNSYVEFISDINARLDELQKENADLKNEVSELRTENAALRTEIAEVKKQAEKERKELTSEVNDLKEKNMALMAEIEKYVKELKLYRKETKK